MKRILDLKYIEFGIDKFFRTTLKRYIFLSLVLILLSSLSNLLGAQTCTVNAGVPSTFCQNDGIYLDGTVSTLAGDPSSVLWTVVSQPAGANAVIDEPSSPQSIVSGTLLVGSYTFQLQQTCTDGSGTPTQQVTHTVDASPTTASASGFDAGCIDGTTTSFDLTGNTPGGGETATWSWTRGYPGNLVSTGTGTASFTPVIDATECLGTNQYTTTFTYSINNGTCSSTQEITVSYYYANQAFYANSLPQTLCTGSCVDLNGACSQNGDGVWTVTGPGNVSFSDPLDPNAQACFEEDGSYTFTWTVTGGCFPGTANTIVDVKSFSSNLPASVDAGEDQFYCDFPSAFSLSADPLSIGQTGSWTQVNGQSATIVDPSSPSTAVTGIVSGGGPYEFLWEITTDNGCTMYDILTFSESVDVIPQAAASSCNSFVLNTAAIPVANAANIDITFEVLQWPGHPVHPDAIGFEVNIRSNTTVCPGSSGFPIKRLYTSQPTTYTAQNLLNNLNGEENCEYFGFTFFSLNRLIDVNDNIITSEENYAPTGYYEFKITYDDGCTIYSEIHDFYFGYRSQSNTAPNAGTDVVLPCGVSTTQLSGNYLPRNSSHTGLWTFVSGPINPLTDSLSLLQQPQISSLLDGTYIFKYDYESSALLDNECNEKTNPDYVRIVVGSANPPTPIASVLTSNPCGNGPIEVFGSISDLAAGAWTQVTPASPLATITTTSDSTAILSDLSASTSYTFRWTLSNGCGADSVDVSFTTGTGSGPSPAIINEGDYYCVEGYTPAGCDSPNGFNSVTLSAISPTNGTGLWTMLPGSGSHGSLPDLTNPTISFYGSNGNVYFLEWSVTTGDGSCASTSRDTITVYILDEGIDFSAGSDQEFCGTTTYPQTVQMAADNEACTGVTLSGEWTVATGDPSNVSFDDPTSPTANVTFGAEGKYTLIWNVLGVGQCLTDNVSIEFSSVPVVDAGVDQTSCDAGGVFTMTATISPVSSTGYWTVESAVNNNVNFDDNTAPAATVTLTNPGQVVLRWNGNSSDTYCAPVSDLVTLTWLEATNSNDTLCAATSYFLETSAIDGVSYSWTQLSGPNTANFYTASEASTVVDNLVLGIYEFQYEATLDACTVTGVTTLVIEANPLANAGDDQVFCGGETVNISGSIPSSGTVLWEKLSGPAGTFGDASASNTTFGPLVADSVYVLQYSITTTACTSTDVLYLYPLSTEFLSYTTTDATCSNSDGAIDLMVEGSTETILTYVWSNGANTEDLSGVAAGIYDVTVTHSTGCSITATTTLEVSDGHSIGLADQFDLCPWESGVSIAPSVSGGSGDFSYLWSTGETTASISMDMQGVNIPLTVEVTDNISGCVSAAAAVLYTASPQNSIELGNDITDCTGDPITLTATVDQVLTGVAFQTLGFEYGIESWTQSTSDDGDWLRISGPTPSTSTTGPLAAASGTTHYLYSESNTSGFASGEQMILESPSFDFTPYSNVVFNFSYNMYSNHTDNNRMGDLLLDVSIDGGSTWTNVFTQTDRNATTDWITEAVDLSAYDSESDVHLRFVAIRGTDASRSDIAIDEISIATAPADPVWSTGATGYSIIVNPTDTTTYTVSAIGDDGCVMTDSVTVFPFCDFTIGDFVWIDQDADGIQDGGELGLNGVTINLYEDFDNNGIADGAAIQTTTTVTNGGSDGYYEFLSVAGGTGQYIVEFVTPAGYNNSPQDSGSATEATDSDADEISGYVIVSGSGGDNFNTDAGFYLPNTTNALYDFNNTPYETPVVGDVSVNDSDAEGDNQITFTLVGTNGGMPAGEGTINFNADGTYTYNPALGFTGETSFTYEVCDDAILVACDTAIVYLEVLPLISTDAGPIIANPDVNEALCNTTLNGNVISNDFDPTERSFSVSNTLSSVTVSGTDDEGNTIANAGTLTLNADGAYTFIPAASFAGIVTQSYIISTAGSPGFADTSILRIEVNCPSGNTTFANDDANATDIGVLVTGDVLANDVDVEGNTETITAFASDSDGDGDTESAGTIGSATTIGGTDDTGAYVANAGDLTLNTDGTYTFTPTSTFIGNVIVTYTKCDDGTPQACDDATLVITILDVKRDYGDAPEDYGAAWHRAMTDANDDGTPDGSEDVWLGSLTSFETAQLSSADASGDTNDDAISFGSDVGEFPLLADPNSNYDIDIQLNSASVNTVYYGFWIDWDNDGSYEDFYGGSQSINGSMNITQTILTPASIGSVVNVRLRADDDLLVAADSIGVKTNGEVEDYQASVVLPVEIVYFKGETNECNIELIWGTESEVKFSHFMIERSIDGINFDALGVVESIEESNANEYRFLDNTIRSNVNYYRLVAVDIDGSYSYSEVITLVTDCFQRKEIVIYPNPIGINQSTLNVKLFAESPTTTLMITNATGHTIQTHVSELMPGWNTILLELNELPSGIYLLTFLEANGKNKTKQFVIQE